MGKTIRDYFAGGFQFMLIVLGDAAGAGDGATGSSSMHAGISEKPAAIDA